MWCFLILYFITSTPRCLVCYGHRGTVVPVVTLRALGSGGESAAVPQGSSVTLACHVKANPPVFNVTWFHNVSWVSGVMYFGFEIVFVCIPWAKQVNIFPLSSSFSSNHTWVIQLGLKVPRSFSQIECHLPAEPRKSCRWLAGRRSCSSGAIAKANTPKHHLIWSEHG